ncbi:MAG TPA: response regulator transcription factor [Terriglobia bacterium]|nr:response regulator transcription factor [Terriglobia bacterium]
MSLQVILADDHPIFRQGLKTILERAGYIVKGEASDGREAVELTRKLQPDVAVLDLSMPQMNGIGAAREIAREKSKTRTILLTMHTEDQYVLEALRAGVRGYVLKTRAAEEMVQAIRDVSKGLTFLSSGISQTVVDAFLSKKNISAEPLTPRELQVLQLIAEGKSTKEAAALLDISFKTAESHRTRIMDKLNIHETAGLVRYAVRRGLVQA